MCVCVCVDILIVTYIHTYIYTYIEICSVHTTIWRVSHTHSNTKINWKNEQKVIIHVYSEIILSFFFLSGDDSRLIRFRPKRTA